MDEQTPELKKFAALSRKLGSKDAWQTRIVFVVDKAAAARWFGENNYEVHGEIYRSGK